MRPTLHLAFVIAGALGATPELGGQPVKPTVDFNDMRVVVSYVSSG